VIAGTIGVIGDALEVRAAQPAGPPAAARPNLGLPSAWRPPTPVLRLDGGDDKAQVGEFFNSQLAILNLRAISIDVTRVRPLGDGLRLAEVTIVAKGTLDATQGLIEWIAVNREALRASAVSIAPAETEATVTLTLLMVVA
jgi:hypothetical protein